MTGDLNKEDIRAGKSGYNLGGKCTRCDGGVDKHLREEVKLILISLNTNAINPREEKNCGNPIYRAGHLRRAH
jgi:hypothetical protein